MDRWVVTQQEIGRQSTDAESLPCNEFIQFGTDRKLGTKRIYVRRVIYFDEDSWSVLIEESYSMRGTLWRVTMHGLDSGSYVISGLDNEIAEPVQLEVKGRNAVFQTDALRQTAEC